MENTIRKFLNIVFVMLAFAMLSSCTPNSSNVPLSEDNPAPQQASKFIYSDTCTVVSVNKKEQSFTFQNLETGLRYTLAYDNLTFFTDRHDGSITGSQVTAGQICNISFYREEKLLKSLEITPDYFAYNNVEGFRFYNSATRMEYLGDKYELDDNIVVCSGNQNISVLEISDTDILTIHGNGHTIFSITVDKGHGYLSLDNDAYFIDGFIEIEKDIRKITEDMMLTVPEGKYNVRISKDGTSAVKEVTVGRNQEATIDLSDVEIKKNYGDITFAIEPASALLYIDGEKIADITKPVKMEYGIHELIIRADGYETLSRYLSVGSKDAEIQIKLTKLPDDSNDSNSSDNNDNNQNNNENNNSNNDNNNNNSDNNNNNDNGNNNDNNNSNNNDNNDNTDNNDDNNDNNTDNNDNNNENQTGAKVYIDAPEGVEVYLDGDYIGTVPLGFDKKIGTIVITLKKEGCQTRSYTITFEEATTDIRYSFSKLLELKQEED